MSLSCIHKVFFGMMSSGLKSVQPIFISSFFLQEIDAIKKNQVPMLKNLFLCRSGKISQRLSLSMTFSLV